MWRRAGILGTVALVAMGCAGDGPPGGEGPQSQFDQIQNEIFDQSCVSGACHDSVTRAGNLSLTAGESYDQLVDIEPDNSAARGAGLLRVLPDSVEGSYLVNKVTGDLLGGEGAQMPIGAPPISNDQIELIVAWIDAGAPEGGEAPAPEPGPVDPDAPTFSWIQRTVFNPSCVSSSCHDDGTRAAGLSLAGDSYDQIVGVEPTTATAREDGMLLVSAGEANASFLLAKLTGKLGPGDGALMPLAGGALPDDVIESVRAWIAAGARDN